MILRDAARYIFYVSVFYVVQVGVSFVSIMLLLPSFGGAGPTNAGCYLTDAMLPYVKCTGILATPVVSFILNLFYSLLFTPLSAWHRGYWFIPMALILWAPIAYFVWYLIYRGFKLALVSIMVAVPVIYIAGYIRHAT